MDEAHSRYTLQMHKLCSSSIGADDTAVSRETDSPTTRIHTPPPPKSEDFQRRAKKAFEARRNAHLIAADCASMFIETLSVDKVAVMQYALDVAIGHTSLMKSAAKVAEKLEPAFARIYDQLQQLQLRTAAAVELERERLETMRQLINDRCENESQATSGDPSRL
jgi:hypothetical protein